MFKIFFKGRSTQRTPHVRQVCATSAPRVRLVCAKKWRTPEKIWITEAGCAWKLIINWLQPIFNLTRYLDFAKWVYLSIKTIHIYVQVQVKSPDKNFFFSKFFSQRLILGLGYAFSPEFLKNINFDWKFMILENWFFWDFWFLGL